MIDDLCTSELVVADFVAKGFKNKEIGKLLNIAECTVKTHINHIYQKFGIINTRGEKYDGIPRVKFVLEYLKQRYGDFEQMKGNYERLVKQVRDMQTEIRGKGII